MATHSLNYASQASALRRHPALRLLLWLTYYAAWIVAGGLTGALALGIMGENIPDRRFLFLTGDDFWGVGLALGVLCGLIIGWRMRRWVSFHWICVVTGAGGGAIAGFYAWHVYTTQSGLLWQLALFLGLLIAIGFVSLFSAGVSGLALQHAR